MFYQPVSNALFVLMNVLGTGNIALGICALVVVVKVLLLPSSIKNTKTQRKMQGISEKLKEVKETIEDKKEQAEKTMEIYRKAGINPLSPIGLLLLQIPFFITIFFVTRDLGEMSFKYSEVLYNFVQKPEFIDFSFFFMDTTQNGGITLAVCIVVSQIVLMWLSQKKAGNQSKNTKIILLVLPFVVGLFSLSIVATVGLYWLFNNLLSILQEIFIRGTVREDNHTQADTGTTTEEKKKEVPERLVG